jgi:hypothetical protein
VGDNFVHRLVQVVIQLYKLSSQGCSVVDPE